MQELTPFTFFPLQYVPRWVKVRFNDFQIKGEFIGPYDSEIFISYGLLPKKWIKTRPFDTAENEFFPLATTKSVESDPEVKSYVKKSKRYFKKASGEKKNEYREKYGYEWRIRLMRDNGIPMPEKIKKIFEDDDEKKKHEDDVIKKLDLYYWSELEQLVKEGRPILRQDFIRWYKVKFVDGLSNRLFEKYYDWRDGIPDRIKQKKEEERKRRNKERLHVLTAWYFDTECAFNVLPKEIVDGIIKYI